MSSGFNEKGDMDENSFSGERESCTKLQGLGYDGSEGVTESRSNSVKPCIFAEIVGDEIIITVAELRKITVIFFNKVEKVDYI